MAKSKEQQEGYAAYKAAVPSEDNPYPNSHGTKVKRRSWEWGWLIAHTEHLGQIERLEREAEIKESHGR